MSVEATKAYLEQLAAAVYQPPATPPPEAEPEPGEPAAAKAQKAPAFAAIDPVAAGTVTQVKVEL